MTRQRKGTRKSCRSIEQVQKAGRSKKKPFRVLENDSEKILEHSQSATTIPVKTR